MAVSKRLRYEILRRDNHTCRYCGASAPDVKLAVDHVIPETLGGSDHPSNLVAACVDCNSGKSATPPDAPVVADVDERATQWSSAMQRAADEINSDSILIGSVCHQIADVLPAYRPTQWRNSIQQILAAGLPSEVVVDLAHVAMDTGGVKDRWKYFFGCCWTRVRKLQDRAAELLDATSNAHPDAPSNASSTCSEQCSDDVLDAELVGEFWVTVNVRHQQVFGTDLAQCMCGGRCESENPTQCRFAISMYMAGWMDRIDIENATSTWTEVDHGASLDPA